MIEFYNVKTRQKVEVPETDVRKVIYATAKGTRYGLRATYEGSVITRFISKAVYEALNVEGE